METIALKLSELQKGDKLTRLRDNRECVFDSFTSDAGGSPILIFYGFSVEAKLMPVMFKNFEREYFVTRDSDQGNLFDKVGE